ncbi:MAG: macro domain-containing protein [Armatimonadetes bacterium]|nr:macro domain-containing protein [Armatimonadota bacterium]
MITLSKGNILATDAEVLVNTVNCEGYMGKGIALQFKKAFPENFKAYERACRAGEVKPGSMFVFATGSMINPRYIINFPTKRKWREKSRIVDIKSGLHALAEEVHRLNVSSIAVPPLGCGLGGLKWGTVKPLIEGAFAELSEIQVLLFEPTGTPEAKAMPIGTKRPKLTLARALIIRLMQLYLAIAHRMTLLEIQKLAYFLQESGEPLQLKYVAHVYGPYAHNLNKVLETLEGHFIRGYGDSQRPNVEIELLPGAKDEADRFLNENRDSAERLERIAELIDRFETPYGMELLSSVHWVAVHETPQARDAEEAVGAILSWSERKRGMFRAEHIRIAWDRLNEQGWRRRKGTYSSIASSKIRNGDL